MSLRRGVTRTTLIFMAACLCAAFSRVTGGGMGGKHEGSKDTGTSRKFEDATYWRRSAISDLNRKLKNKEIIGKAKNVIMFLGDGWDIQTMTAARIIKGQQVDLVKFGEEAKLYLEEFYSLGLSKTYCTDSQVGDSACTVTAYLGGVKTNRGTIGVTPDVNRGNCAAQKVKANQVEGIVSWAQAAGKSTGVVTTTSVTDATPAGCYAHTADRNWECDADMIRLGADPHACEDIARQLILRDPGKKMNVVMGGGRTKFLPDTVVDVENNRGERKDGRNLIENWKASKEILAGVGKAVYVESAQELAAVNASNTDYLLGLFAAGDLAYYHDERADGDPRLVDMTRKAIEILSKNQNGYFLLVEGGNIDNAHHANWAQRALWESIEFDRAVEEGDKMTEDCDTLIVVTADHGHVMVFAGYPPRGNPIMGVAGTGSKESP